jgi:hypothetical protein
MHFSHINIPVVWCTSSWGRGWVSLRMHDTHRYAQCKRYQHAHASGSVVLPVLFFLKTRVPSNRLVSMSLRVSNKLEPTDKQLLWHPKSFVAFFPSSLLNHACSLLLYSLCRSLSITLYPTSRVPRWSFFPMSCVLSYNHLSIRK